MFVSHKNPNSRIEILSMSTTLASTASKKQVKRAERIASDKALIASLGGVDFLTPEDQKALLNARRRLKRNTKTRNLVQHRIRQSRYMKQKMASNNTPQRPPLEENQNVHNTLASPVNLQRRFATPQQPRDPSQIPPGTCPPKFNDVVDGEYDNSSCQLAQLPSQQGILTQLLGELKESTERQVKHEDARLAGYKFAHEKQQNDNKDCVNACVDKFLASSKEAKGEYFTKVDECASNKIKAEEEYKSNLYKLADALTNGNMLTNGGTSQHTGPRFHNAQPSASSTSNGRAMNIAANSAISHSNANTYACMPTNGNDPAATASAGLKRCRSPVQCQSPVQSKSAKKRKIHPTTPTQSCLKADGGRKSSEKRVVFSGGRLPVKTILKEGNWVNYTQQIGDKTCQRYGYIAKVHNHGGREEFSLKLNPLRHHSYRDRSEGVRRELVQGVTEQSLVHDDGVVYK